MDNQHEVEKMTNEGLSVADAMALNKEQGFGDQVWPLVWLAALGGGNGLFGRNNAAEGVTVAGIDGLQNQINGLLNTINANTDVLQNDSVKTQLYNMGTLIQSGNADITAAICKCCCDLKQQICDLGYQVDREEKELWCLLEKVNKYICLRGGKLDKKEAVPEIPMQWRSFQQVFDSLHSQQKKVSVVIEKGTNALAGENAVDAAFIANLFHEHLKELSEIATICDHMFATPEQSNIDWDRYLLKEYGGDE